MSSSINQNQTRKRTANSMLTTSRAPPRGSFRTGTRTRGSTRTGTKATTFNSEVRDSFVVAITHNTFKDVGICAYNLNSFDVELRQFGDNNSYTITLATIHIIDPVEIILSSSPETSSLIQALKESEVSNIKITFVPRQYFNDTNGYFLVDKYTISKCPNLLAFGASARYLALASFSAVIQYTEQTHNISFIPNTLRIRLCPIHVKMFLDLGALEGLDIVTNTRSAAGIQKEASKECMLNVIDFTLTRAGRRKLRRELLEPSTVLETIVNRQDAIEELFSSESHYNKIRLTLKTFPDLERTILTLLNLDNIRIRDFVNQRRLDDTDIQEEQGVQVERDGDTHIYDHSDNDSNDNDNRMTDVEDDEDDDALQYEENNDTIDTDINDDMIFNSPPSDMLIQSILNLKAALLTVESLLEVLPDMSSILLARTSRSFRAKEYQCMLEEISAIVQDEALPQKNLESKVTEGAFAVAAGRNARLDMLRSLLSDKKTEMDEVTPQVREKYRLQKVRLRYHSTWGYHMVAPRAELDHEPFPSDFIHLGSTATEHNFTVPELDRHNLLFLDNLKEIWTLTAMELGSLLNILLQSENLMALYHLCDSVAMLDYLTSLVTYQSMSSIPMTRPTFHVDGPLIVKHGHHPLLLRANSSTSVPNNVFMSESCCLHIISGRNHAGKSCFIRMVGSLVILAHIGCFVPADIMIIPIVKRIATKLSNNHDIISNASHFSREMRDISAIYSALPKVNDDGYVIVANQQQSNNNHSQSFRHRHHQNNSNHNDDSTTVSEDDTTLHKTLVLIDELGRATCPTDGFAFAWCVAKDLAETPSVFTLFTTHFQAMNALSKTKPFVQSSFLQTISLQQLQQENNEQIINNNNNNNNSNNNSNDNSNDNNAQQRQTQRQVKFTYKVCDGMLQEKVYGFETARAAGFPECVVQNAEQDASSVPVSLVQSADEFLSKHFLASYEESKQLQIARRAIRFHRRVTAIQYSGKSSEVKRRALIELQRRTARHEESMRSRERPSGVSQQNEQAVEQVQEAVVQNRQKEDENGGDTR